MSGAPIETRSAFASLVRRTPLVAAAPLGARLKLESLQRTGSFKLRGACLRLDALSPDERRRGVVASSAGNHGLGVALAGRTLGIDVEVLIPAHCPDVKRNGIAALGARVSVGGASYDEAEVAARALAVRRDAVFVSPFDDELVIRGNGGTLAEEILAQAPDVDRVVCPVGGGGLASGLASVLAPRGVRVTGAQPKGHSAMHESLALGRALTSYEGEPTIAEGCEGGIGERTFAICREHGVDVARVDEDAIRRALVFAYRELGLAIEPTAAVAIAAVRERAVETTARTVVVISGGNLDHDLLDSLL